MLVVFGNWGVPARLAMICTYEGEVESVASSVKSNPDPLSPAPSLNVINPILVEKIELNYCARLLHTESRADHPPFVH